MTGVRGSEIKKDKLTLKKVKEKDIVKDLAEFCKHLDSEQLKLQLCCLYALHHELKDADKKLMKSLIVDKHRFESFLKLIDGK